MKGKSAWAGIAAGIGMLILILDSRTALEGASAGIQLCIQTLIPALYPFFVLSIVFTGALAGISFPVLSILGKACGLPPRSEALLIPAFLGGYPVGAQAVSALYHSGTVTKDDAQRMLGFCSNAGPAFLFGMASVMFSKQWMVWSLWGIHILGAIAASILIPGFKIDASFAAEQKNVSFSDAVISAAKVMTKVCGWVVLMRVWIAFLKRWILWLLPNTAQVIIIGFLELSNGCYALTSIPDESVRFILCAAFLGFGGVCVAMQTISVTQGLSCKFYFLGKALQTLYSVLFAWAVTRGLGIPFFVGSFLLLALWQHQKKNSGILQPVGV